MVATDYIPKPAPEQVIQLTLLPLVREPLSGATLPRPLEGASVPTRSEFTDQTRNPQKNPHLWITRKEPLP